MTDWVTIKEAVDILGISERTIHRRMSEGKINSRLEKGRRMVFVGDSDNPAEDCINHANPVNDNPDDNANNSADFAEENANSAASSDRIDNPAIEDANSTLQAERIAELSKRVEQLETQNLDLIKSLQDAQERHDEIVRQIQSDAEAGKERSDTIILTLTQQVEQLTKQNQLLLEDLRPTKRWYHRLFAWNAT